MAKRRPSIAPDPPVPSVAQTSPRVFGAITRRFPEKGFGFLRGEDGVEYFFHISEVEDVGSLDLLRDGQAVQFDPVRTDKGWRATRIRVGR